jgi:hypothetical protein
LPNNRKNQNESIGAARKAARQPAGGDPESKSKHISSRPSFPAASIFLHQGAPASSQQIAVTLQIQTACFTFLKL